MKHSIAALALAVAAASGLAWGAGGHHGKHGDDDTAFGRPADPAAKAREVAVGMSDAMRFDPAEVRVKTGEAVKFVVANHGKVDHEFVLGTMDEIKEHAEMMRKMPNMEHDDASQLRVKPGAQQALAWQFDKPGEFYYACLVPGHFEAGMVGKVIVSR